MALELINTDNVADSGNLELQGARALHSDIVDGTTYVFAAGWTDDGISVFSIGTDGVLTNVYNVADTGDLHLNAPNSLTTEVIDGTTYLFVTDYDGGISVFSVESDGTVVNVQNVDDTVDLHLDWARSVATTSFGDTTYAVVAGSNDSGVSVFEVDDSGVLTNTQNISDDGILELDGAGTVATVVVNSVTYVYVGAANDFGISAFRMAPDGMLTNIQNVDDADDAALNLASVNRVTTAKVGDTTYLFANGFHDDGISVFSVGNNGTLSNVYNLDDDGTGDLLLDGINSLTTSVIDGVTYLFATSEWDGGFSVFSVADTGALTNVANVPDDGDLLIKRSNDPTVAVVDGQSYLVVSSPDDNGVSVFRLEHNIIDETAMMVEIAENGMAVVTVDKLYDDDTLAYTITGGDDAALFSVDAATGAVTFIDAPDFEAPEDADGDNIYDIEVTADDGIITEAKALAIEVTDVGGLDISGTNTGETLTGGGEADTIAGRGGKDILQGLGGGDLLDGGKKRDTLFGGDGEDQFSFSTRLKNKWADRIEDFEVGDDTILLDSAIFDGIGVGALKGKFFNTGKKASDGNDHVLWQKTKGWLRYDADGKGGDDAVKFARLDKHLDLSADDFLIV